MSILHWLNVEIWGPIWPNMVAPSIWTLVGIGLSHVHMTRHSAKRHEELKDHITKTLGSG